MNSKLFRFRGCLSLLPEPANYRIGTSEASYLALIKHGRKAGSDDCDAGYVFAYAIVLLSNILSYILRENV